MARTAAAGVGLLAKVAESLDIETLTDEGETTPQNNSSVVLLVEVEGRRLLLTADAGMPALTNVADLLEFNGYAPNDWNLIQVPHHGSRRNVGPTILDRIVGPKQKQDAKRMSAYISAAKDGSPKHPAKKVCNAFRRRGAWCYATQGSSLHWGWAKPARAGWGPVDPLPLYPEVDD